MVCSQFFQPYIHTINGFNVSKERSTVNALILHDLYNQNV